MRIIAGLAKGKKILNPVDKKTRPLKDMVRESIFNILNHSKLLKTKIDECVVLDLFSGVGSFGLEAISRGVKKVVFFEDYKEAVNILIKNLSNLQFEQKAEIIKKNIYQKYNFKNFKRSFDIIFIDPPFKDQNLNLLINNLINSKVVRPNSLIIIHRNKKTLNIFDNNFKIIREEIYGSSKIIFGFAIC